MIVQLFILYATVPKMSSDFGNNFKAVKIWYKGKSELRPLVNGKIDFDLSAGYAVYVMPY